MAITRVATSSEASAANDGGWSVPTPSGAQNGDVIIIAIANTATGTVPSYTGDSFTNVYNKTDGLMTAVIGWRIYNNDAATYTGITGAGRYSVSCAAYRGVNQASPFVDENSATGTGTTALTPTAITATAGSWAVGVALSDRGATGDFTITSTNGAQPFKNRVQSTATNPFAMSIIGDSDGPVSVVSTALTFTPSATTSEHNVLTAILNPDTATVDRADGFTATGDGTWTCPVGVMAVRARCWGGGGAGGGVTGALSSAGGGAGGSWAEIPAYAVTPGTVYSLHVATTRTATTTSSAATNKGDVTWFKANDATGVVATGGIGAPPNPTATSTIAGATASSSGSVGTTVRTGGSGSFQNVSGGNGGGGGGGGAGSTANGADGALLIGGVYTALGGGVGGTGTTATANGNQGFGYASGGSGGNTGAATDFSGGTGSQGYIELYYTFTGASVVIVRQALNRASLY